MTLYNPYSSPVTLNCCSSSAVMYSRGVLAKQFRQHELFRFAAICENYNYCCITGGITALQNRRQRPPLLSARPPFPRNWLPSAITPDCYLRTLSGAYPYKPGMSLFPVSNSAEPVFPQPYTGLFAAEPVPKSTTLFSSSAIIWASVADRGLPADEGRNFLTVWPPTFSYMIDQVRFH